MVIKSKLWKIILLAIALIAIFVIGVLIGRSIRLIDAQHQVDVIVDTAYNKTTLDSIDYNIIKKDSVIHKLRYEMDYETKKVYTLDDSATIELFYQLCAD